LNLGSDLVKVFVGLPPNALFSSANAALASVTPFFSAPLGLNEYLLESYALVL